MITVEHICKTYRVARRNSQVIFRKTAVENGKDVCPFLIKKQMGLTAKTVKLEIRRRYNEFFKGRVKKDT